MNTPTALFESAIAFYLADDFAKSFRTVLQVLRLDPLDFEAQGLALRILNRIYGKGFAVNVQNWIDACQFGNMDNAAMIVPGISDDSGEIYILCTLFAAIACRLGYDEVSLRLFGHCVTDDLPQSAPLHDTESEYRALADGYDDNPIHQMSVTDFATFLFRHLGGSGPYDIIDAPCGTGLAGPALAPLARRMVGCDLSAEMLAKAEQRGCYDTLIAGDLTEVLPRLSGNLMVCLGSLYYFKDLAPITAAAAAALHPGGWLAFSDFPAPRGVMATIHGNPRYCRGKDYVRETLSAQGFTAVASDLGLYFGLPCLYWLFRKGE
ncbi:MAG: methyltransferase domain-containing protein [Magnetospirillum sp.]|nr:MAG: methyltransferase domain-containing protein [Magnetospirillum sp.]